jgi:hypothetical protein
MKTDKEFKCVDFKHEAQMQIYKEIKNLTPEGEIEYFRRSVKSSFFGKWWEKLPARGGSEASQQGRLRRHGGPAAVGDHNKTTE